MKSEDATEFYKWPWGGKMRRNRKALLMTMCGLVLAIFSFPITLCSESDLPRPVKLKIVRLHSANDCTSGQILLEGAIVGYTLERPWEGNIPLISSIPIGRYHGFVRTETKDRWRIELTDVPKRPHVQLHLGNFVADGVGCILIGSNLTSGLCQLKDSKAAFDKFKLAFSNAAARLGQSDTNTPVELLIVEEH
jgi:hypothetical protein